MLKTSLKYLSVPFLLLSTFFTAYFTIHLNYNYEYAALGMFLFASGYLLFLEHIIPLKKEWKTQRQDILTEIKYLLSVTLFDSLGKTASLWFILLIQQVHPTTDLWTKIPFIFSFIIANIIGELLPYLYHRLSHVGNENSFFSLFLWKVHSIHHLPVSLNWFKTNWMHPMNMVTNTFLKYGILMFLGFNEEIIFAVGVTHVVIAYLSHANIDVKTGVLDYIIVTPKVHQFHHSKNLDEAQNFGNILPLWDLIFGTFYIKKHVVKKVGVSKATYNYPPHRSFLTQQIFPFYTPKNCCLSKKE
ncbi:sterol desaturase family protein [Mangrovivirga sp. M17]|uniref:Sterol desaturase family protein n=1 Tax=Mangrovivirga halotolerans TaxID=2993936 RepID=A0ABT3RWT8_9BACT|nr:sterol desaturase family protein [Mangrovivirga halotolerans]MCX2745615.1 sterol desaturase family protein [Mangrovivirga halotolerans]